MTLKFLALQGAPYIYDMNRLRVNTFLFGSAVPCCTYLVQKREIPIEWECSFLNCSDLCFQRPHIPVSETCRLFTQILHSAISFQARDIETWS
jgi:hypothetical protein